MKSIIKTIIIIILFIAILAGAFFAYTKLSENYKQKNQVSDNSGETIPDELEKIEAPDFTVYDADNNPVKLSDLFGKPIVLNFWASWCSPCKAEMPFFDEVYNELKDSVTFVMVDLVDGQLETVKSGKSHIETAGYSFPVYFDTDQQAAYNYGISSIPSTLFIDKDGNIVTFYDNFGNLVSGYKGAIDKETLLAGIALME